MIMDSNVGLNTAAVPESFDEVSPITGLFGEQRVSIAQNISPVGSVPQLPPPDASQGFFPSSSETLRLESLIPELGDGHRDMMDMDQGFAADQLQQARNFPVRSSGSVQTPPESPRPATLGLLEPEAVAQTPGMINRNFTNKHCTRCGVGFDLQVHLDQHAKQCRGRMI